jgi:hypothetical protein
MIGIPVCQKFTCLEIESKFMERTLDGDVFYIIYQNPASLNKMRAHMWTLCMRSIHSVIWSYPEKRDVLFIDPNGDSAFMLRPVRR